ncbi:glucosyltransferase [Campylobacterota bacterium]|nr:glucosyltransferase [Campylobacterota bacterium]
MNSSIGIKPVFDKNAVAIMMAADDNYAPYCGVMIQSIKENSNQSRNYDIVIAGTRISQNNKELLESMQEKNISIRVIDINGYLKDMDLSVFVIGGYLSVETYYRLFIPKIFAGYNKVIYLDIDMVVLRDTAELYDTNIGDNWWGATHDKGVLVSPYLYKRARSLSYLTDTLRMKSYFDYFQAGVMVWNIQQCIKDNVFGKCIDRLKEIGTPKHVDQCAMNSVANGKHIFWLSSYWDVLGYVSVQRMKCDRNMRLHKIASHLLKNPFILHFSGALKPWDWQNMPYANKFWQYAQNTPFYEVILRRLADKHISKSQKIDRIRRKAIKYTMGRILTLGLIKSFRVREADYREQLEQLQIWR